MSHSRDTCDMYPNYRVVMLTSGAEHGIKPNKQVDRDLDPSYREVTLLNLTKTSMPLKKRGR